MGRPSNACTVESNVVCNSRVKSKCMNGAVPLSRVTRWSECVGESRYVSRSHACAVPKYASASRGEWVGRCKVGVGAGVVEL